MSMHAAVVRSFDHPPRYESYDTPEPAGPEEALIDVLAVGLHPRVRSGAAGRHYTSTGTLPMIPGVDGVGRLPDGRPVYFVADDDTWGTMADKAVVDLRRVLPLPEEADVTKIAAAMNPAMSSWVALRRRVELQPGQSVLVLGATGNAGAMAVQVAKRLGAGQVIGAGRNPARLAELSAIGADEVVALDDDPAVTAQRLAKAAAEVDIVVDYLWGEPAAIAITALLTARADRGRALDWIEIGSMAGPDIRAAVGGAPLGQSPAPGQRAGLGIAPALPGRAAVTSGGDRRGYHRGQRPPGPAGRRRGGLDRPRTARSAYGAHPLGPT